MIDIHSHILPGLDDGARDLEQSLELARQAVREGIHTVIATPHHRNGRYDNPGGAVRQAAEALARELAAAGIPLKLRCGQEIRVYAELPEDLERGEALTLNGSRYLLLELPSGYVPQGMDELLHELRVMGRVPVIAHPERNRELAADPGRLAAWVRQGVLLQLTSHSVSGALGPRLARLCLDWCRRNLVLAGRCLRTDRRGGGGGLRLPSSVQRPGPCGGPADRAQGTAPEPRALPVLEVAYLKDSGSRLLPNLV